MNEISSTPLRFKDRHPFIFWVGVLVVGLSIFSTGKLLISSLSSQAEHPKIAVVRVEGMILDSKETTDWVDAITKDNSIKAVVLRINSPGGGVAASEEIYTAIARLNLKKPVVASMGSFAASGGLFVAMGAGEIVANYTTLTGSIGVKMELPNLEGIMGKLGIAAQTLTTGELKDAGSMYRTMLPKEKEYLMAIMNDMNAKFIDVIATSRKQPKEKIVAIADGRALTGAEAQKLGLVDHLGDFEVAVEVAKEKAGVSGSEIDLVEVPEKKGAFIKELLNSYLGISVQGAQGLAYRFYY